MAVLFFFTFIEEILCCDRKEHRQKSWQIELVTKFGLNMIQRMLKRKVWFGGSISAVTPASQWRRQKTPMILQIAPLTNQISVLGGIVVPIADVGCHKKCPAMVKVGLSRFQKLIREWRACITDITQDVWKIRTIVLR